MAKIIELQGGQSLPHHLQQLATEKKVKHPSSVMSPNGHITDSTESLDKEARIAETLRLLKADVDRLPEDRRRLLDEELEG
jgi:hypothetical protein